VRRCCAAYPSNTTRLTNRPDHHLDRIGISSTPRFAGDLPGHTIAMRLESLAPAIGALIAESLLRRPAGQGACLSILREPRWQGEGRIQGARRVHSGYYGQACKRRRRPSPANPSGPAISPHAACRLLLGIYPTSSPALPEGNLPRSGHVEYSDRLLTSRLRKLPRLIELKRTGKTGTPTAGSLPAPTHGIEKRPQAKAQKAQMTMAAASKAVGNRGRGPGAETRR